MASVQEDYEVGSGPEYEYPTTDKDTTVPVLEDSEEEEDEVDNTKVVGEDAPDMNEADISREEELEDEELADEDVWSEDKAPNVPLPGEAPDLLPEEAERLPSDKD